MSDSPIHIKNLFKKFKIYEDVFIDRLKEKIFFWKRENYYRYFTALEDINLKVEKGEVLGIVGPNGAGKTTLLKILAGISHPTSGDVSVNGSLVAVLALGLGFNPRFTGRENIVISGCLLGMSLEEIREKEEWIIDFSELKEFIDQPIRSYSTGMWARLSFSVAAAVSPDILMIDEALATGDALFVQKSLGRIHEICKSGTTAIFVSHNLQQIQRLCSERVILMDKGKIVNDDKAFSVLRQYNDIIFKYREEEALKQRSVVIAAHLDSKDFTGNADIIIERVYFTDDNGNEMSSVKTGENVNLHLDYTAKVDKKNVNIVVVMENYSGICAYGFKSDNYFDRDENNLVNKLRDFKKGKGEIILGFKPLLLTTNKYLVSVTLYDADAIYDKDSDYYAQTIFRKQHMAELIVLKPMDLNTTLVFEHPVHVEIIPK